MKIAVVGAGAIGGAIGGLLQIAGHPISVVARGAHLEAIEKNGLTLETATTTHQVALRAVGHVRDLFLSNGDVVVLAVKSQDTNGVIAQLRDVAPPTIRIVCAQNGVENERRVLRHFANTYGMCVMCAATHLHPGVVQVHFSPVFGILDVGRYPKGSDETAIELTALLRDAGFDSQATQDIMTWKYRKLINNTGNAVELLCGPKARGSELAKRAMAEAEAIYGAVGIHAVSSAQDHERRGRLLFGDKGVLAATKSGSWEGGSTWQSAMRGAGSIEAGDLNGQIVLLARLAGKDAPINAFLARRAEMHLVAGEPVGSKNPEDLLIELESQR